MCGKFTQMMSWAQVHDLSEIIPSVRSDDREVVQTLMSFAHVVRLDASGARETVPIRWGFAGLRAKTPLERPQHMHARADTIDTLSTFAGAFTGNRGLVFVKTFNIGEDLPNGRVKQHVVRRADGQPMALAVIWELWTDRNEGQLLTYVMVTTEANTLIAAKSDRMPAIIPPAHIAAWLGETGASPAELKALLKPYEGELVMSEQAPSKPPRRARAEQENLF